MSMIRLETASQFAGLPLERVKAAAPSVFAEHASPKMSERYAFVSTAQMIEPLLAEGFVITHAVQRATRARNPMFTRHMLRMRQLDAKPLVGDVFPEVVLTNAHDGQSKWILHGGLFRLICLNGMVTSVVGSYMSVVHRGLAANLMEQAMEVVHATAGLKKTVKLMAKATLDDHHQALFANEAARIAYDESSFDPKLLLEVRRPEDRGDSVWKVFNRVQENVMRGGVNFQSRASGRQFSTRGLTHIGRTIEFNKQLWELAEKASLAA